MGATIHTFHRTQPFPDRIEACLQACDWGQLQREILSGFDPGITAYGGLTLFECIVHRAEQDAYVPPLALPRPLLDVLLRHGLPGVLACGKPAVVACVEYGQWEWAHVLLDAGFPAQNSAFPVLDAMALGRAKRCEDAVLNQVRTRLASVDGNTAAERAAERNRRFSMAMMDYAKTINAKDARSISSLVHRLVVDCGVDVHAPIRQEQVCEPRNTPGIRNIPAPLDNAILRQDEAMAFALLGAGARADGAVMVDPAHRGSVACRPADLALSARCYDLFIHIIQSNPECKHPFPGTRHPADPAAFPLSSVLVSNLLPLENAAPILDELLRCAEGFWTTIELADSMHVAAKAGHVGMMKVLASHGVAYDVRTTNGFAPIHQACDSGHMEAIDFLLSKGCRLSDQSSAGVKAFDLLQASSPSLAAQYTQPPASNVVMLRARSRP